MTTFLVGTDFSELSQRALNKAVDLAINVKAKIHLLHVLEPVDDPDSTDPETEEFYDKLKARSNEKLVAEADQLKAKGVEVDTEVIIGPRYTTILNVSEQINADLLVLGSLPLKEDTLRIGTSHKVAMTSTRAVLLVP